MNRNIAFAFVLATAAVGNAFADDITVETTPFTSTASRAEVQAELAQFKRSGANPWALNFSPLAQFHSSKTRAQVVAEFMSARDEVSAFNSEDSGSSYMARDAGTEAGSTRVAGQPLNAQ